MPSFSGSFAYGVLRSLYLLSLPCLHGFAAAQSGTRPPTNITLSGSVDPSQLYTFFYVPFEVPPEVTSIYVFQNYSFRGAGNSLDLGIFDPRGFGTIDSETGLSGLRGWSGPIRNNFTITPGYASPSYNAGPIQPGTWNIVLGPYATNRSGIDWTLDITLGYEPVTEFWEPTNAPMYKNELPIDSPTWLRGDFHGHTIFSDGRYTPSELIALGFKQDLDFMFITEHNTDSGNNNVGGLIPGEAKDLLVGRGMEVTTRYGHWQALGLERGQQVEWRYTNATNDTGYANAARQVQAAGGLVSVNHPYFTCNRCAWAMSLEYNDAMEVWNGYQGWGADDEKALKLWHSELLRGRRITAIGGADGHAIGELPGLPTTVVGVFGARSQAAIIQGVKDGRTYIAREPSIELEFQVEYKGNKTADMGDRVKKATLGADATAVLSTTGVASGSKACFVGPQGYLRNVSITEGQAVKFPVNGLGFIRVEVRNSTDGMLAMTNPIWFD